MEVIAVRETLVILISYFAFATGSDHNYQRINSGDKIHLLCQYDDGPITGCTFKIPGEELQINLLPNLTLEEEMRYKYFGKGFDMGECGLTITNVSANNQGYATCVLTLNDTLELSETIEVRTVDRENLGMSLPKMKILNDSPLKVGQTLVAECTMKSLKDVIFFWLLNDEILSSVNDPIVKKKFERDKGVVFESTSRLRYDFLETKDNGSVLKCRAKIVNDTHEYIETTLPLKVYNDTRLWEPQIGEPYDISIKFFAFPRVLSSRWKVNHRNIYYGKASNEFISRESKYLGKNQWNAFLHISNVTKDNLHYNYSLLVNDSYGEKNYQIRLDNLTINTQLATLLNKNNATEQMSPSSPPPKYTDKIKSISTRRVSTKNVNTNNNTQSGAGVERKIKVIRKQHQQNTSIKKMTSVIVSSTTTAMASSINNVSMIATEPSTTKAFTYSLTNTNEVENMKDSLSKLHHAENVSSMYDTGSDNMNNKLATKNDFNITTSEMFNTTTVTTVRENEHESSREQNVKFREFLVSSIFITLILIIIVISILLCHYRQQVSILKTEIIQLNLESYYSQSCLYPSTFNDYSASNIQHSGAVNLIYDNKRPLSDSSDDSTSIVQAYTTNSHLYQSIDEIETHVYDEIISSLVQKGDSGNQNFNESNESFNNINEILIPQHCQSLMTIEEVDEYESSQSQKLANLESTYI